MGKSKKNMLEKMKLFVDSPRKKATPKVQSKRGITASTAGKHIQKRRKGGRGAAATRSLLASHRRGVKGKKAFGGKDTINKGGARKSK